MNSTASGWGRDGSAVALETIEMTNALLPAHDCDVALRDGSTVRIRPATPLDAESIVTLCARLSPESVYLRFFNVHGYDRDAVDRLLTANGRGQHVVVAECGNDIVGLAQYARDDESGPRAETAFLVADAMRGRGIGTRMLEELAEHARENGISEFWASVLPNNERMLHVFLDSGFGVQSTTSHGVITVTLSIAETALTASKAAERASVSAHASLAPFFEPQSAAVVGIRQDGEGVGAAVLRNLRQTGFRGRLVAIHPSAERVQGVETHRSLAEVPGQIDLVVVVVPADAVLSVVRDAIAKHVRAVVVISAGFAESGPEGRAREEELLALVRGAGVRLIGPNCMGILNAAPSVLLNATFSPAFPPPGRVAFSTQSGALGLAILDYARRVNLGISTFASIGNKADVSSNDLLQYWADDPHTGVILLYLESFGNPRKFAQLARSVGQKKPIIAVKAGRSVAGARAASSHTGALAASDRIVDALFRHAGVIRTGTIEEMFDVAVLLDQQPLPRGARVAILTNAGGPGILAADACEAHGLTVAALENRTLAELRAFLPSAAGLQNPIDMLATASAADFERAARILLSDPNVDSVIAIFIPPIVTAAADVAAAVKSAAAAFQKPVVATFMSVADAIPMLTPVPCYRFPESAVRALAHVVQYSAWREKPVGRQRDHRDAVERARAALLQAAPGEDGWLTPSDAQTVLDALGLPGVESRAAISEVDAVRTATALGYPVVLKGFGPRIVHKSDVGAVRLDLADEHAVGHAYREMAASLGPSLAGVLVQKMAPAGVEMFIGGLQDPVFGPVVFAGSGGVLVELFRDAACRMCPATDRDVDEMLAEVRGIARLRGYRGAAPADEDAYRDAILRVAALLDACPEIHEMDINPVRVGVAGLTLVDARIRVGAPVRPRPARRVRY